jgi:transcriptional regulator with XRE-family HTH domain
MNSSTGNSFDKRAGYQLKKAREDNNSEKQDSLASVLGCSQSDLSKLESGKRKIPAEIIAKAAKYYGLSCDYFCMEDNANGMLDYLNKYIKLEYRTCDLDDTKNKYLVLSIDSALLEYLYTKLESENMKNLPNRAKELWQNDAANRFRESKNDHCLTFLPLPIESIVEDLKESESMPAHWPLEELFQISNDNIVDSFS